MQVLAGPLSEHRIAVVLWNRSPSQAVIKAKWKDIGLPSYASVKARNIWKVMHISTNYLFERFSLILRDRSIVVVSLN